MDGMRNDSSHRPESSVITRIEAAEVLALPRARCEHRVPADDRGLAIGRSNLTPHALPLRAQARATSA